MSTLAEIKKVIRLEARELLIVEKKIGVAFEKAVQLLLRCPGKIIVTGIGKSGLVAQKIAATFSSTGTPAIYLHPSEGMHGNLGIVHKNDLVLGIGKSGESEELLNILPSIKKIGAKIIALTSNKESTLARQSNLVLHVPIEHEACPHDLAPTTSATAAMVIGDALAIVLMKKRGFGPDHFALFHPGGILGKRLLLTIGDVMRSGKNNPVVQESASMDRLLIEISRKWTGAASIVNKRGKLIGLVTDYDIRQAFAEGKRISDLKIKDIMNARPIAVRSDQMAIKALEMMEKRKKPLTVLPVVDRQNRAVGMIHLHDLVEKGLLSRNTRAELR